VSKEKLSQTETKINAIKKNLQEIGEMRPGSLTRQYKDPATKSGGSFQISYTHHMQSRTEYVRPQFVKMLKKQIAEYKKYRKLVDTWLDLAIEQSKLKIKLEIEKGKGLS
jgi:hypothetical protein